MTFLNKEIFQHKDLKSEENKEEDYNERIQYLQQGHSLLETSLKTKGSLPKVIKKDLEED